MLSYIYPNKHIEIYKKISKMGWFSKKEGHTAEIETPSLPQLPELPELPELPLIEEKESIHKLPRFPTSQFGERFSQNTIKHAVGGFPKPNNFLSGDEKGERVFEADEFEPISTTRMMPKTQKKIPPAPFVKRREEFDSIEKDDEYEESMKHKAPKEEFDEEPEFMEPPKKFTTSIAPMPPISEKKEPVYIRIDKFESGMKTFEKTKKQIFDIEKNLEDISKMREEESKQLESWKNEVLKVKEQINRVDQDIFSKVE